ncbi:MgtC/SapB family protein [Clostridium grantii]|uniref:Putative Mg2+ transporter-C (MgtC) family protein n=1 Tax=Clostridium grantii DSM 8605 TaxID=1121316 RepID=A0A1M5UY87_9CLOT|nr:MgtC/SapB family protein [Clostridium grantii]SHH67643.1 putative Mg2+ transporter-C (MgtC) family protein [Clostridium grantii DSM 8605]
MLYYEIIIRLLLAIFIGGLVGYEREYKHRPAGFRTHILVCVGATVVSMIQIYDLQRVMTLLEQNPSLVGSLKTDIGRLGAQVITGVGFLGAGTIIRDKGAVKGLTTAASLWVVACIGLAVGMGYYFLSIVSTLTVFIALVSLKKIEIRLIDKSKLVKFEIEYYDKNFIRDAEIIFDENGIKIKNIEFDIEENEEVEKIEKSSKKEKVLQNDKIVFYTILIPRHIQTSYILSEVSKIKGVSKIEKI